MSAYAADSAGTRVGSTGDLGAGRLVLLVIRPRGPLCPSQQPGDARVPRRGDLTIKLRLAETSLGVDSDAEVARFVAENKAMVVKNRIEEGLKCPLSVLNIPANGSC
eukprot:4842966-Pleurochrysis_carterae.AAC.1